MNTKNIPYGFCQCGCGKPTPQYTRNRPELGVKAGDHHRVIRGHWQGTAIERLMKKVHKRGEDDCWEWFGAMGSWGGRFRYKGSQTPPSRAAYDLMVAPVPDNLLVCHKCDNPICCNPKHLFLGTQSENMIDCVAKGRHVSEVAPHTLHKFPKGSRVHWGESSPQHILNESQVIEILRLHGEGQKNAELAKRFGVHPVTISGIVTRRNWKHIKFP